MDARERSSFHLGPTKLSKQVNICYVPPFLGLKPSGHRLTLGTRVVWFSPLFPRQTVHVQDGDFKIEDNGSFNAKQ